MEHTEINSPYLLTGAGHILVHNCMKSKLHSTCHKMLKFFDIIVELRHIGITI